MRILRTPDERFADLPDFPFAPHYSEVTIGDGSGRTLRVHYLDEGPTGAPTVLLMHGEPSWSFLYRSMIPGLVSAGLRCIAPDLVGFGRSDKPAETADYTYARHVAWMDALLVEELDLHDATFFGQDWGGLVGLRIVTAHPERFDRIVVANTGLPTGDQRLTDAFAQWQKFSQEAKDFPVGGIVNGGCGGSLSPDVIAAYDAPFPSDEYKAGARIFPSLVPTTPDDPAANVNRAAWKVLEAWTKPLLTAFSDSDPITAGGFKVFQERVPGAAGRDHVTIEGAHHFLQEEAGPRLADVVAGFVAATS